MTRGCLLNKAVILDTGILETGRGLLSDPINDEFRTGLIGETFRNAALAKGKILIVGQIDTRSEDFAEMDVSRGGLPAVNDVHGNRIGGIAAAVAHEQYFFVRQVQPEREGFLETGS